MPKLSERGVIHLLLLLILLLGIAGGVLLVTRGEPLKLLPKAVSGPILPPSGFGKAIKFNNESSNNAYVVISPIFFISSAPSAWTLEGWIKTPKPAISGNYLRDYSLITLTKPQTPYDKGYIFRLSLETQEKDGSSKPILAFLLADSFDTQSSNYVSVGSRSSKTLLKDTWYHIAVTYESLNNKCSLRLYVNGQLADSADRFKNPSCKMSTQQPQEVWLARPPTSLGGISGYYYPGTIDSARLIRKVIYTSNFTPPFAPFGSYEYLSDLIALYNFDGNSNEESTYRHKTQAFGDVQFVDSTIGKPPSVSGPIPPPTPTLTPKPTATPTPSPTPPDSCVGIGDVNLDGKINSTDSLVVLRIDAGYIKPTDEQKRRGDVNGDGKVDSSDSLIIQRYDAGFIKTFPVCVKP